MPKISSYGGMTPILTDLLYGVDDPGGTPISDSITITALRTLLEANFVNLTATDLTLGGDAILVRDDADILAQRNSTTPQVFRVYKTFTDASNYERGVFNWNGNDLEIGSEAAGTGSIRTVKLKGGGDNSLTLGNTSIIVNMTVNDNFRFENGQRILEFIGNQLHPVTGTCWSLQGQNHNTNILLRGGNSNQDNPAGVVAIAGGNALGAASTNLVGAICLVKGGDGASGSSGDAHGGAVWIRGGTAFGTGDVGNIVMDTLPTSDPSVTGALWNNSGVLTVS